MKDLNKIQEDGITYDVSYRYDKTFAYAKAIIKGHIIEGRGTDETTAYWSLEQKIYQTFHFSL